MSDAVVPLPPADGAIAAPEDSDGPDDGEGGSEYDSYDEEDEEERERKKRMEALAEEVAELKGEIGDYVGILDKNRKSKEGKKFETPICHPVRLEKFGTWMQRRTGKWKDGGESAAKYHETRKKSLTSHACRGNASLMQLDNNFKIHFMDLQVVNPDKVELFLYLSNFKAKRTMGNVEDIGEILNMEEGQNGCIGIGKAQGTFSQVVPGGKKALKLKGLYICKPAKSKPVTSETVVYGYLNFAEYATPIPRTKEALGMGVAADEIEQLKGRIRAQQQQLGEKPKGTGDESEGEIGHMKRLASRSFRYMKKNTKRDKINYEEFKSMMNYLDVVMLEPRAKKVFNVVDLENAGQIEVGELELALHIQFHLPPQMRLTPEDAFITFDLDGSGQLDMFEYMEAAAVLGVDTATWTVEQKLKKMFHKLDKDSSETLSIDEFKHAWAQMVNVEDELQARGIPPIRTGWTRKKQNIKKLMKALKQEEAEMDELMDKCRQEAMLEKRKLRLAKEDILRAQKAQAEAEEHKAAKEEAKRRKLERFKRRKEQEEELERHRKEMILKKKMEEAEEARRKKQAEDFHRAQENREAERLRILQEGGLDTLTMSQSGLREIPLNVYQGKGAGQRLSDYVSLDFSRNKIMSLPASGFMFWMTVLRRLDLSHNRLEHFPGGEVDSLGSLEILRLNNNDIRELPDSMGGLHSLKRLDISQNRLKALPAAMGKCAALEVLQASGNNIEHLPPQFGDLYSLKTLDLAKNKLFELPDEMALLSSLQRINISWNEIVELPNEIGYCEKMQIFDAACNNITVIPESFGHLHALHTMHLAQNNIKSVTDMIGGLTSLRELDFSQNEIKRISPKIQTLLELKWLNFHHNKIVELPDEFGMLTSLQHLDLSHNKLTDVLPELGGIQGLQMIDMSYNKLNSCPPNELGLCYLLLTVDLSHNEIPKLPPNLGALGCLEHLNVSYNNIEIIPESLANLKELITLNVAHNKIRHIPYCMEKMEALEKVDFSCNKIEYICTAICSCPSLTSLDLYNNNLRALPHQFSKILPQLVSFNLSRNEFKELPDKFCEDWTIKEQYQQLWSGYKDGQVVDWAVEQSYFYEEAKAEWLENKADHMAGHLSLDDFLDGVQRRLGAKWEERFADKLQPFYFECTEHGLLPGTHASFVRLDSGAHQCSLHAVSAHFISFCA
jgi:Leucine-rich repeat (LRR) protein/Ca2+-binding EF-hand superfamily protein